VGKEGEEGAIKRKLTFAKTIPYVKAENKQPGRGPAFDVTFLFKKTAKALGQPGSAL
jgi:hypothetical protein